MTFGINVIVATVFISSVNIDTCSFVTRLATIRSDYKSIIGQLRCDRSEFSFTFLFDLFR